MLPIPVLLKKRVSIIFPEIIGILLKNHKELNNSNTFLGALKKL